MSTTVILTDYNDEWPAMFQVEKAKIMHILNDVPMQIEHIGSTSIEGMKAKPIIDILIGVEDLSCTKQWIERLATIDYEYVHKPELVNRRFFRKGLWGQGTCHLHVCELTNSEWHDKMMFRDYLRSHHEAAAAYMTLKEQLAETYQFDRPTYTERKGPFIQRILTRGKEGKAY